MSRSFIEIKNLSKYYYDSNHVVHALDNVSLSIEQGEIFGLLGVNGAGKTTLSSILATLHPASSGTIECQGKSIYEDIFAFRKILGFCPQKQNLDTFLTVEENLIFAGRYYLMPEEEIAAQVAHLMETFELTRYAQFSTKSLSGGNKQRVLIARALMHNPRLVILDEPTVGLDPDIRRILWDLIKQLKEMGITVILTTHYLDEAEYLSDRICVLHKGKVRLIESLKSLKNRYGMNRLEDIFLALTKEHDKEDQE